MPGVERFMEKLCLSLSFLFLPGGCEGVAQLVFRSFSEEMVPYVAVDPRCPREKVTKGSSCVTIWNHLLPDYTDP